MVTRIRCPLVCIVALGAALSGCMQDRLFEPGPVVVTTFSFDRDVVTVPPASCVTVTFTAEARPPLAAGDVSVQTDVESMGLEVVEPLMQRQAPGDRLVLSGSWRACNGSSSTESARISVTHLQHTPRRAEVLLTTVGQGAPLERPGAAITLPLRSAYPTDVRWSDGDATVEIATADGLILHLDPDTAIIQRTEAVPAGGAYFVDDTHLLVHPPSTRAALYVDRALRQLLATIANAEFAAPPGDDDDDDELVPARRVPMNLVQAHGAGGTIALAGSPQVGFLSEDLVYMAVFDLTGPLPRLLMARFPTDADVHEAPLFPHVVVAPNGRYAAWTGLAGAARSVPFHGQLAQATLEMENVLVDLAGPAGCAFSEPGALPPSQTHIAARPSFSSDSGWLAHWSIGANGQRLWLHAAPSCRVRASTDDLPSSIHRGAVAVRAGGDLVAAVAGDELIVYEALPGEGGELAEWAVLPAIPTPPLDGVAALPGISDRFATRRQHHNYPGLAFSEDGTRLVSANTRGAYIHDLEGLSGFAATPVIVSDDIEAFGTWVRVGVIDDDDTPGGDLIYNTDGVAGFVHQLADDELFGGIDASGWLYTAAEGLWSRRNLRTGAVELLGTDEPTWTPPTDHASVSVTATTVELRRR
mgnify:CR=1 FL=1